MNNAMLYLRILLKDVPKVAQKSRNVLSLQLDKNQNIRIDATYLKHLIAPSIQYGILMFTLQPKYLINLFFSGKMFIMIQLQQIIEQHYCQIRFTLNNSVMMLVLLIQNVLSFIQANLGIIMMGDATCLKVTKVYLELNTTLMFIDLPTTELSTHTFST